MGVWLSGVSAGAAKAISLYRTDIFKLGQVSIDESFYSILKYAFYRSGF